MWTGTAFRVKTRDPDEKGTLTGAPDAILVHEISPVYALNVMPGKLLIAVLALLLASIVGKAY
jgi:hypothetical protein